MKKSKKFPKRLYVCRVNEGDKENEFMENNTQFSKLNIVENTNTPVAVYELKEVRTAVNKTELIK